MILALDVAYGKDAAVAGGVWFATLGDPEPRASLTVAVPPARPYQPGRFHRRELPCLLSLLENLQEPPTCILIDGYVDLGAGARPGLGRRLWQSLGGGVPVVGIAKSPFPGTPERCRVLRGRSARPLYVTCAGMPLDRAKDLVRSLHGAHRIPTLLRAVDNLCRGAAADGASTKPDGTAF